MIRAALTATLLLLIVCGAPAAESAARKSEPASPARIAELIGLLGAEEFFARERAQEELQRIGLEAFDALVEAEHHDDTEIADRAKYLLKQLQIDWSAEGDSPEVARLLQAYRDAQEDGRVAAITDLAKLPNDQGLPALCRIVRYERSAIVTKLAALEIVRQTLAEDADWSARKQVLEKQLATSQRPPAQWIREYIAAHDAADHGAAGWMKLADAEVIVARRSPGQSSSAIVTHLYRQAILALRAAGQPDEAVAAMRKLIDLEPEDSETLIELLGWLIEQKAWPVVNEAAERFADRFQDDPLLLYTLAEGAEAQGNSVLAEEMAARARALNPQSQPHHFLTAYKLQRRSRFAWAEQEFRLTVEIGQPGSDHTLTAQSYLAEMLHDLERERSAAEVLQQAITGLEQVRAAERNAGQANEDEDRQMKFFRARMHFFSACAEAAKNPAKQREHLLQGIAIDPTDADVLIALYQLPEAPEDLKKKTRDWIRAAVDDFRDQIRISPENAMPYNQLAWLIANTEGDRNEALRCSEKSLQLKPDDAGYTDTLARCHFALGELEEAVKQQKKAVEAEPHSGQMRRQLEQFEAALAAQRKPS